MSEGIDHSPLIGNYAPFIIGFFSTLVIVLPNISFSPITEVALSLALSLC